MNFSIEPANDGRHKYVAIWANPADKSVKRRVPFGGAGFADYTLFSPELREERRRLYIARHKKNQDWNNPYTAGALSRWILWEFPTISQAVAEYKKKFGFK